jgi:small subunit ribosomal protein S2
MQEVNLLDLLKSGAHFGQKTSRWNPKMKPYIFTVRNDVHILDLEKTKKMLTAAGKAAAGIAQLGGTILFVGTKRQSRAIVKEAAEAAGMPFVNVRWLGGTFTNFKTIQKTIRKLERLEGIFASSDFTTRYTKKERLLIEREIEKLTKLFEGIKNMRKLPDAIFVADINHDDIAVKEAKMSGIKIFGVVDTNSNPEGITYPIACNDDATKAIALVAQYMAGSIVEGKGAAPVQPQAPAPAPEQPAA